MSKECPHCGVDDFRLWDLVVLTVTYSDSLECANCGGQVRNSGWGEFLTLSTTALLVFLDFVLLLPFVPEWVIFSSLIALIPLPTMIFAKPVAATVLTTGLPPFNPDYDNDKIVTVNGWSHEELCQALDDFRRQDRSGAPLLISIQSISETRHRLNFPEDVPTFDFAALVNYLTYPIDPGSPERIITVAGKTTLNTSFAGIPKSLWGSSAILYVPDGDEDHDVVYLRTESGAAFANSLNQETVWRRVNNPRLPAEIMALG